MLWVRGQLAVSPGLLLIFFLLFKSMAPLPLFDLVYMHSVTTLPEKKPKLHSGRMGRERQKPAAVATPDQSLELLCRVVFRV